jgi:hypothetical protein
VRKSRSRNATAKAAPAEQAEAGGEPAEAPVRKSRARNATAKAAAKAPEPVAEAPVRKSRARNATAKPGGGTGDGAVVEPAGEAAGA